MHGILYSVSQVVFYLSGISHQQQTVNQLRKWSPTFPGCNETNGEESEAKRELDNSFHITEMYQINGNKKTE
jgi:hypothetical protein